jgi:hypothetical protein
MSHTLIASLLQLLCEEYLHAVSHHPRAPHHQACRASSSRHYVQHEGWDGFRSSVKAAAALEEDELPELERIYCEDASPQVGFEMEDIP